MCFCTIWVGSMDPNIPVREPRDEEEEEEEQGEQEEEEEGETFQWHGANLRVFLKLSTSSLTSTIG